MSSPEAYTRNWKLAHNGRYNKYRTGKNWFQFDFHTEFPKLPCCYVIYLDGLPCYVGSTVNLYKRFHDPCHRITSKAYVSNGELLYKFKTKWGEFDDAYVKIRFSEFLGDWAQKEIYLIDRLKPMYNKMYNW